MSEMQMILTKDLENKGRFVTTESVEDTPVFRVTNLKWDNAISNLHEFAVIKAEHELKRTLAIAEIEQRDILNLTEAKLPYAV